MLLRLRRSVCSDAPGPCPRCPRPAHLGPQLRCFRGPEVGGVSDVTWSLAQIVLFCWQPLPGPEGRRRLCRAGRREAGVCRRLSLGQDNVSGAGRLPSWRCLQNASRRFWKGR